MYIFMVLRCQTRKTPRRILRRMLMHSSRVSTLKSFDIAQLTYLFTSFADRPLPSEGSGSADPRATPRVAWRGWNRIYLFSVQVNIIPWSQQSTFIIIKKFMSDNLINPFCLFCDDRIIKSWVRCGIKSKCRRVLFLVFSQWWHLNWTSQFLQFFE
jgi:hypothetical protein